MTSPNVIVVGAGIIGASVAYHLAKRGARVTVVERNSSAGADITGISFGWVGLSSTNPTDDIPLFKFRASAIEEYARLESELGIGFQKSVKGALVWRENLEATNELVESHQVQNSQLQLLTLKQIARIEPRLKSAPQVAAYAPNDFAIEPPILTKMLLKAAKDNGASVVFEAEVVGIKTNNGNAVSIVTESESYPADVIVLANGTGAEALISDVQPDFRVQSSPSTFLRLSVDHRLSNHILSCNDFELRHAADSSTILAERYPTDGEAGLPSLAAKTVRTIEKHFHVDGRIQIDTVKAGFRPYPLSGMPQMGFMPNNSKVYTAIAHPGVMLAPFIGRVASEEILDC